MKRTYTKAISGIMLCFLFFQILAVNLVSAQPVDIWGVSENDSRAYNYKKIYTGSISSTDTYPKRTYRVARIFDQDGNDHMELLLQTSTTSEYGLPEIETEILDDWDLLWTNDGLRPDSTDYFEFNPLYPTIYNGSDNVGFDWTDALNEYNTNIDDWNMTISGNTATINGSDSGTESGSDYTVLITIQWDISTGWLISYDEIKAYNETLGYTVHYQTVGFSVGLVIDLGFLLSIIAIIVGCVGITFAYLAYRKLKQ